MPAALSVLADSSSSAFTLQLLFSLSPHPKDSNSIHLACVATVSFPSLSFFGSGFIFSFKRAKHRKSRSSVFLFSPTPRKRLPRRLQYTLVENNPVRVRNLSQDQNTMTKGLEIRSPKMLTVINVRGLKNITRQLNSRIRFACITKQNKTTIA